VESTRLAFTELRAGDRVAVMSFNTKVRLEEPFSSDLAALQPRISGRIRATAFGGGTFILDAVDTAASYFLKEKGAHRRRAILVFTDDAGHGFANLKTVVKKLWEADAVVSGLILPGDSGLFHVNGPNLGSSDIVDEAAAQTGGDVVDADPPGATFQEAIRRMRQRYSLFYATPAGKSGETRKVTVDLSAPARKSNPGAKVLARKGYILQDSKAQPR
jgi:hypothetical protein